MSYYKRGGDVDGNSNPNIRQVNREKEKRTVEGHLRVTQSPNCVR